VNFRRPPADESIARNFPRPYSDPRKLGQRAHGYANLHLLVEPVEYRHQPIHSEAIQLGVADAREVGRGYTGDCPRLAHGNLLVIQHADDLGREDGFQLLKVGVSVAEVAEDVAAASHDFDVVGHLSVSFTRLSRC